MKFPNDIKVFGDQDYRGACKPERVEQIEFFAVLRSEYPEIAAAATHVRNEGKRGHGRARMETLEGMTPGFADVLIAGAPALLIELKRRDHTQSRWQPGQIEHLRAAAELGAFVCVALGAEAAVEAVEAWRKILSPNAHK